MSSVQVYHVNKAVERLSDRAMHLAQRHIGYRTLRNVDPGRDDYAEVVKQCEHLGQYKRRIKVEIDNIVPKSVPHFRRDDLGLPIFIIDLE